mmetsp:Transcript_30907/g.89784  ORF Transcript_30907/g.89784 Transcript_30907/m.89784 type:complete len:372 (-) Transcript_30907:336-1451(-)
MADTRDTTIPDPAGEGAGAARMLSRALESARPSRDSGDALAEILSRLGIEGDGQSGGAASTVVSGSNCDVAVAVLVEVLQIDGNTAAFYLESSNFDVAVAVNLHFETSVPATGNSSSSSSSSTMGRPMLSGAPTQNESSKRRRTHDWLGPVYVWKERDVPIMDLTPGWRAFVSSSSGRVMFEHLESGFQQSEVPPGYANEEQAPSSDEKSPAPMATHTPAAFMPLHAAPPAFSSFSSSSSSSAAAGGASAAPGMQGSESQRRFAPASVQWPSHTSARASPFAKSKATASPFTFRSSSQPALAGMSASGSGGGFSPPPPPEAQHPAGTAHGMANPLLEASADLDDMLTAAASMEETLGEEAPTGSTSLDEDL